MFSTKTFYTNHSARLQTLPNLKQALVVLCESLKGQEDLLSELLSLLDKEIYKNNEFLKIFENELISLFSNISGLVSKSLTKSKNTLEEIAQLENNFNIYFLEEKDKGFVNFYQTIDLKSLQKILNQLILSENIKRESRKLNALTNHINDVDDGILLVKNEQLKESLTTDRTGLMKRKEKMIENHNQLSKQINLDEAIPLYADEIRKKLKNGNKIHQLVNETFLILSNHFSSEFNVTHKLKLLEFIFSQLEKEVKAKEEVVEFSFFKKRNLKFNSQELEIINQLKSLYINCVQKEFKNEDLKKHINTPNARALIDFQQTKYEMLVSRETTTSQAINHLIYGANTKEVRFNYPVK